MKPHPPIIISPKRRLEILKSWEEFEDRQREASWTSPEVDSLFRLAALIQFHPSRSTRQIFNAAGYVEASL